MHQTKKGNQWYFGMKAHVGVDSRTKLIHCAVATAANVADARCCPNCFTARRPGCGATRRIAGRGGDPQHAPQAQDFTSDAIAIRRHRRSGAGEEPKQVAACAPRWNTCFPC